MEDSTKKDLSQFTIELRFQLLKDIKGKYWLETGRSTHLRYSPKDKYNYPGWHDMEYKDWEFQAEPVSLLSFLLETGEDARSSVRAYFTKQRKLRFY